MANKVIISCAVTGCDPHAQHVGLSADHAGGDRARLDRGGRGGRRDHPSARARPADRRADARSGGVHALPAGDQAERRRGGEHHHRRRADHDAGRPAGRAAGGEAGDVQPEHGQHELQHLPRRRPGEGLEVRLGEAVSRRHRQLHLPQHVHATSPASSSGWARRTARGSSSSATTSGICTTWPIAWIRRSSSRRCSCRRSSAFSAASAPIRATCCSCAETADKLFGDDYVWSVLAAGRHQMAFTTMAGIHGRQRAGRAGGQPVYRPRRSWRSRTPSRWRRSGGSWRN